jgi:hypothetical protein
MSGPNNPLVPTRNGEAPLLAAQRHRYKAQKVHVFTQAPRLCSRDIGDGNGNGSIRHRSLRFRSQGVGVAFVRRCSHSSAPVLDLVPRHVRASVERGA